MSFEPPSSGVIRKSTSKYCGLAALIPYSRKTSSLTDAGITSTLRMFFDTRAAYLRGIHGPYRARGQRRSRLERSFCVYRGVLDANAFHAADNQRYRRGGRQSENQYAPHTGERNVATPDFSLGPPSAAICARFAFNNARAPALGATCESNCACRAATKFPIVFSQFCFRVRQSQHAAKCSSTCSAREPASSPSIASSKSSSFR